ncbi:hypothetical protein ACQPYA_13300 [Micromonospora sp. CA-263727]|uniref:hypothetical protein n=1 Tax=Micromonospora sp. CA-263727 TaxID=3239967 RepID=UPI003D910BBB
MSDSHSPYGGQPDPNAAAWGAPPGSPVGPPTPSGYPPQFGAPAPPPYGAPPQRSSNTALWLGLGIGAAVMAVLIACGGTIGFFLLSDDKPTPSASGSSGASSPESGAPSVAPPVGEQPDNNNAVTARNFSDMQAVCEGSQILNAAPYREAKSAKIYTFANSPERPQSWVSKSAGVNKRYYAKTADWATVSVVGCLTFEEGSEGEPRKCEYKDRDGKQVTVDYLSSRYTLTFHAARTGEKIGDGVRINAPAVRCPGFISYNKATMKAYAQPDTGALELALDTFTS